MQEFILRLGVRFSDEEKRKCLPTAYRLIKLANIAYENGILALEQEVIENGIDSDFMKMGANLIFNGVDPELVEKIFQHSVLSGGYTGADMLDRLLIAESFRIIQFGGPSTTMAVAYMAGAMLGEKYIPEIMSEMASVTAKKEIDVDTLIEEYTIPLAESANFEERLLKLTKLELSYVLLRKDLIMLTTAFKGCNKSFIEHMRSGLPESSFERICELFRELPPQGKDEILIFQKMMLEHIDRLENSEVIVTPEQYS